MMGQRQTETSYPKSVLLWLQGILDWTSGRVSMHLERCHKRRGTIPPGGRSLLQIDEAK